MPAAAVIPAPRVYIRFVVVKKLVVETRDETFSGELSGVAWRRRAIVGVGRRICSLTVVSLTKD